MKPRIGNKDFAMFKLLKDRCIDKLLIDTSNNVDYNDLANKISDAFCKHMRKRGIVDSECYLKLDSTTVRKWWSGEKPVHWPTAKKLNSVCISIGYEGWDDFYKKEDKGIESMYYNPRNINIQELINGDEVVIGWYPEHYVIFDYLGENKFRLKERSATKRSLHTNNEVLKEGDVATIYGFGISYIEHLDTVIDSSGVKYHIGGYPLYPKLLYRKSPINEECDNHEQGVFIIM